MSKLHNSALKLFSCGLLLLLPVGMKAQCFGTVQFPNSTVVPLASISPTTISTVSYAGDYALVSLTAGGIYRFSSSVATDHITVSTAVASGAVTFGTQPVLFAAAATQNYFVHFHTNAACGAEEVERTTQVQRLYCAAGTSSCGGAAESITRVSTGAIDNISSGCGGGGYSDFSSQVASVFTGQPVPITVVNSTPFAGDVVRVFVDWDRNFNLADAGEAISLGTTDNITFTGSITAPLGATAGLVRMRVRLGFGAMASCGNTNFGEVEDYTLNVGTFGNGLFAGGGGRGDVQLSFTNGTGLSQYIGGDGRGDVQLSFTNGTGLSQYLGGDGRGDVQLSFTNGIGLSQYLGGDGRGDVMLSFSVTLPSQIFVSLKGVLEGPYSPTTGLMGDALRVLPSFPLTEPYTALGYAHTGGGGGETVAPAVLAVTGNDAIVDWVVVELRDAFVPTSVVATRSALVQRDGDVVGTDGVSPVSFNAPTGSYNVALRHRNHLGVMENNGVALSSTTTAVDLSSVATATFGTAARKSITGTFPTQALWAGDVTFNGQVKYTGSGNDRDPILTTVGSTTPNNTVSIYSTRDVNLNGQVKYTGSANDRDPILVNVGSTTPNNVRVQQLP
ncbi:MAG: hypothetical protein KA791_02565 [Flavobacteriales bacterium]|nr:hypothetical protein [Flavobacteriales bacterium]